MAKAKVKGFKCKTCGRATSTTKMDVYELRICQECRLKAEKEEQNSVVDIKALKEKLESRSEELQNEIEKINDALAKLDDVECDIDDIKEALK